MEFKLALLATFALVGMTFGHEYNCQNSDSCGGANAKCTANVGPDFMCQCTMGYTLNPVGHPEHDCDPLPGKFSFFH